MTLTINSLNSFASLDTVPLCRVDRITKTYPRPDSGGAFTVLDDVSLDIMPHEIVVLLGRSGCGKSTILRSVAGLILPTSGSIYTSGRRVTGPNPDVAMVFQSFALLPWLSVRDNVLIGLESQRLAPAEARARAESALKMVGLDGFENAYPRELSGGMQQRVGFARAFVVKPKLLLLDEPFSALDVLTAENLRGEIADLWEAGNFPAESALIVTHNIEEAVLLADKIVLLGSNPGRVRGEIAVELARPRLRGSDHFKALVDHVYTLMTNPDTQVRPFRVVTEGRKENHHFLTPLPHARPGAISGLLERMQEHGGPQDVAVISARLQMEVDDFLPILDAAVLLGFAEVHQGDAALTPIGSAFVNAEVEQEKEMFGTQCLLHAPLVRMMHEALRAANGKSVKSEVFLDILDETYSADEAQAQFETAVNWGRFAGFLDFDMNEGELRMIEEGDERLNTAG